MSIRYSDRAATQLGPIRSPRLAEIARLADATGAQGMADGEPAGDPPADDPPADDPPADDPAGDKGDDTVDVDKIKADARKSDNRAKKDREARERIEQEKKASDEKLAAVLKAAGLADDDDPAEKLKATAAERDTAVSERDDERSKRVTAERHNLALRAAYAAGGNVEALWDSAGFLRSLDGLGDENGEASEDDVKKLIADTLKAKPQYKATAAPPATPDKPAGEPKRKPDVTPGMGRMREAYRS